MPKRWVSRGINVSSLSLPAALEPYFGQIPTSSFAESVDRVTELINSPPPKNERQESAVNFLVEVGQALKLDFDKLPDFEHLLHCLNIYAQHHKTTCGRALCLSTVKSIFHRWHAWIKIRFNPPPAWFNPFRFDSYIQQLKAESLIRELEVYEPSRIPHHVLIEMIRRLLQTPDPASIQAALLIVMQVFLLGRLADIIATRSKPNSCIRWKDVTIRIKSMATLEQSVLEVKLRDHKGIQAHAYQPLVVWHTWDARNGLSEPIEIVLRQAMYSGQIGDLKAAVLDALETNNGVLVWKYPERPLLTSLTDFDVSPKHYDYGKQILVNAAVWTNCTLARSKLVNHAIRRSGAERLLQLPSHFLEGCGSAPAAAALYLGHSLSSYRSNLTTRYVGRRRDALFNERSHNVETPEDEGLHLFFSDIASPAQRQAQEYRALQEAEKVALSREIVDAVLDESINEDLLQDDEAAADLEGFGAEMEEDGEHTVDEEVLAGRTLVASEALHRSPPFPSDQMPKQTDLFANAGASSSNETLVRDHASAKPAVSQSPASFVLNNEYELYDERPSTARFDFGVSDITPAGVPAIVARSAATSEGAHTMTQIPTSHVAVTRDPAVLMGEQVVVRASFGANEGYIIGAHGKESAQATAGRGQEWGQGFQGVERPSMHRDVAGHAWTNIGDGFGGSRPYHSGATSQTVSAHVMGSPSAQARPDDIAFGGFVPRSSIHSELLSGMIAPQMPTSQPYDVETSALRDRPDNAMLDNSTVGGVVDPTASLGERRCQSSIPRTNGTESLPQRAWPIDPTLDQWAAQTSPGSTGVPHPAQTFAPSANTVAGSALAVSNGYSSLNSLTARSSAGTALGRQNSSQKSKWRASQNKNKVAPLRSIQVSTSWLDDADVSTIDLANPPTWLVDSRPGGSPIAPDIEPTALEAHAAESGSSAPTSASNKRQKTGSESYDPQHSETENSYTCEMPECREDFATFQERARHYMKVHNFLPCPFPGCTMRQGGEVLRDVREYDKMNKHLRTHAADISVCLYGDCFRVFRWTEDYVRHKRESHSMAQCPMVGCLEIRQNNSSIMKHFHKEHLPIDQHLSATTLQCRYGCDQVLFATLPELKAHVADSHDMAVCPTQSCYIFFPSNRGHDVLWSHAKSHKDAAENVMEKERYALTYIAQPGTTITVDLAIKIVDGQKQYECLHSGCTRSYTTKGALKTHMYNVHRCSSVVKVKD